MGKNKHLANPLIHRRVGRQRRHLAARQLHQPHLALLGHHLRAHEADLLLRGRGLGLDLPDELGVGCQRFVVAVWGGGGLLMPDDFMFLPFPVPRLISTWLMVVSLSRGVVGNAVR